MPASPAERMRAMRLRRRAQGKREVRMIMADKPVTVRWERIGSRIGRLDRRDVTRLNSALAFVSGLENWTDGMIRQV